MPINLTLGNSAQFIVEYLSSTGARVVPATGTVTVTYYQGGVQFTDTINLTAQNSFFTGVWNSSSVDYGPANWAANAPGVPSPAKTGTIRVIPDP